LGYFDTLFAYVKFLALIQHARPSFFDFSALYGPFYCVSKFLFVIPSANSSFRIDWAVSICVSRDFELLPLKPDG